MTAAKDAGKTDWSKTVNLPRTAFPMKADLPKREPDLLKFWEDRRVYHRLQELRRDAEPRALHDGPPYANGHIHIGHALNKILKDIVVKSHAMRGFRSPYIPGWDCHGLPIELQLLKQLKMDKRHIRDVPAFRKQAADFARKFIGIQREEFKRLGVLGEWDKPYTTMDPSYEAAILEAFRRLLKDGYIYRGLKTVSWCAKCETALAEAEVEYAEKTSPSVFVALPIKAGNPFKSASEGDAALIWTTTPWTLPANAGMAFHADLEYARARFGERVLILAKARLGAVAEALGEKEPEVLETLPGKAFAGMTADAPFSFRESKGILAGHVSAEEGTGIVHTAPGHGAEDFEAGKASGLPIVCPVDPAGRFTEEAGPFQGLGIWKANPKIVEALRVDGRLLAESEIRHSYPHCWRCKQPTLFRATEQWFLAVDHDGLKKRLVEAIGTVEWIPAASKERITGMVKTRPDWCISRQRVWGTPIPVLYCEDCGAPYHEDAFLSGVVQRAKKEGAEFWFAEKASKLAPPEARCAGCGGSKFRKEMDVLDVWVDSGASWLAVLKPRGLFPCQVYLEGGDQHRGWFQASLVPAVALEGRAPFRQVFTNGWVLDDKGRAMHKSLGNVVSPQEVIAKWGADVLRLWVVLSDHTDDVRLSEKLLAGPADAYRKIRNTIRYLLGNTFDFDPEAHAVAPKDLLEIDRYMLARLDSLVREVGEDYAGVRFRAAARALTDFCILDLSAFYLAAVKERLYTAKADSRERRSAQTVLYALLVDLLRLLAPMLSFTAEEAWHFLRDQLKDAGAKAELAESVHWERFPEGREDRADAALEEKWGAVRRARDEVNAAVEKAKGAGKVKGPAQAKVLLGGPAKEWKKAIPIPLEAFAEAAQVAEVVLTGEGEERSAAVEKAEGEKCPRCWRWRRDLGADPAFPEVCAACAQGLR